MGAVAGWYDDGSGRPRWWDGEQWTDRYADQEGGVAGASGAARTMMGNLTEKRDPAQEPDNLWWAVGKPVSGIGGGRYRLTQDYLIFEKGVLSTRSQQIRVHEIFDVDATQTMTQKARGVGSVALWAQRPGGWERVVLEDIDNFREGVSVINQVADAARQRMLTRQNTQHLNYNGSTPPASAGPAPAAAQPTVSASTGLNDEIARLADLHERGILDDAEFAAAKRKLLGL
ncbi:SHOCT domain-containing protein [Propioniciclava soli]|uniref:SHOCT domain-containing protein n=1 Tax=Propioniciclava soli TaxID=2775081 RepID=A0ABZ3C9H0_9ACTN|nr:SHOCT domain-containing protein [Propioniciclava soli]